MPTDGLPESLLSAGGGLSEQLFQLCEELLDRVQVRRVGWQIRQARACCLDRFLHAFHLVDRKTVHQNRLPRLEFRRQHLLDVNPERVTVHGTIDYERCDDPTCREVRHDGRDLRKRLLWTAFFGFARGGMIAGLAAATAMSWSHGRSGGSCRRLRRAI